jgi:hypothetical protein
MNARLLLLARPGCELCEAMVHDLLAAFPEVSWQIEEADVDSRPEWQRRYGFEIPVLLDPDGSAVCRGRFDEDAIREWLRARH